jgi:hypothetical protein
MNGFENSRADKNQLNLILVLRKQIIRDIADVEIN